MNFDIKPLRRIDIERVDSEQGRFYQTPEGNRYISVTQFLGQFGDKTWLQDWKDRVGEEKVSRVSTQAKVRGTAVHRIAENYLFGNEYLKGEMPFNIEQFRPIQKELDKNVHTVYGIEQKLYSDRMRLAGTADLIATWKGNPAIIDLKTSKYPKKKSEIPHYLVQATIYALMVEELHDLTIDQIVILMTVNHETDCFVFEKNIEIFKSVLLEAIENR